MVTMPTYGRYLQGRVEWRLVVQCRRIILHTLAHSALMLLGPTASLTDAGLRHHRWSRSGGVQGGGRSAPDHAAHDVFVGVVQPVLPCGVQHPVVAPIVVALHSTERLSHTCHCVHTLHRPSSHNCMVCAQCLRVDCGNLPPMITESQGKPAAAHITHALWVVALWSMKRTLVRMSVCGVLDARSCTLMARCTMGMSRPLMLNTTISPARTGRRPMCL